MFMTPENEDEMDQQRIPMIRCMRCGSTYDLEIETACVDCGPMVVCLRCIRLHRDAVMGVGPSPWRDGRPLEPFTTPLQFHGFVWGLGWGQCWGWTQLEYKVAQRLMRGNN